MGACEVVLFSPDHDESLSTLPADYKGNNTTAEIQIDHEGRFLYVSNRGHDSVAVSSVDAAKGTLTMIVRLHYADGKTEDHKLENGVHRIPRDHPSPYLAGNGRNRKSPPGLTRCRRVASGLRPRNAIGLAAASPKVAGSRGAAGQRLAAVSLYERAARCRPAQDFWPKRRV